mmetsp:Transcript_51023/g.84576  ORF Transcript_51023/g.84576 Transcript_51023/m.84576 type:complete len:177 (+) Transcript_51023:177-707(+)|eukprot:CAMPEP_0119331500 /NCGR_PEP_ID=MMETSP1333-20130426/80714_1 /TAXON_ID=418940 /ORGANISM="Scyphosphaera apsteinii, Strain RCC1455" /LENGTH=176 /DNA_ID=CAMNT_0007341117 /DNA_START=177 /DNA_END=707 /DNA_ORIENTATION=+
MKPNWDALAQEFASSSSVLIADVDCTGKGEPLCEKYGVEGFPTIKYFNPPDEEGEDYDGGRDLDELKKFAMTELGPGCSISTLENCSAEEKEELDSVLSMTEEARSVELEELESTLKSKEGAHAALLESLQSQYDASEGALEEYKKKTKPRIKLLKKAGSKSESASSKDAGPKDEM